MLPEFHRPWNENTIKVNQPGFTIGITMLQKVRNSPLPSMRAASRTVSGTICSMNCFIRYRPMEEENAGRISAQ